MDPAHVVLLLGVTIAVVAIAGHLIAIILILRRVIARLVVVLGAVDAVIETSQPVGAIINDINRDLDNGRQLVENGVERLADRKGAPAAPSAAVDRHPPPVDPMPDGAPIESVLPDGEGRTAIVAPPAPAPAPPPPPPRREPDGAPERERERPSSGLGGLGRWRKR